MQDSLTDTLAERGQQYGDFTDHARITQGLKRIAESSPSWNNMSDVQKEGLEMILHKTARILNGDPNISDSWHDIAGYATLVRDRLTKASEQRKYSPTKVPMPNEIAAGLAKAQLSQEDVSAIMCGVNRNPEPIGLTGDLASIIPEFIRRVQIRLVLTNESNRNLLDFLEQTGLSDFPPQLTWPLSASDLSHRFLWSYFSECLKIIPSELGFTATYFISSLFSGRTIIKICRLNGNSWTFLVEYDHSPDRGEMKFFDRLQDEWQYDLTLRLRKVATEILKVYQSS